MRLLRLIAAAVLITSAGLGIAAQSGGKQPTSGGKANSRPKLPTPSPTPKNDEKANTEQAADADGPEIVVDTRLVTIPVRVLDRKGRFVPGLAAANFTVFEDGKEQTVAMFSNEAQPFTVALVLDMSYSAKFKAEEIQNAAIEFIGQLRPGDRVTIISFDEEIHVHCEPTSDRKAIYAAIRQTKISTGTSLYEAVDLTINDRLRLIEGRKAMVLFTDGVDTSSRRSTDLENLSDAMEVDTIIYPIRYDTFADVQRIKNDPMQGTRPTSGTPGGTTPPIIPTNSPGGIPGILTTISDLGGVGRPGDKGTTPEEYAKGEEYLNELALRTGGRAHVADTLGNLTGAFAKIAAELREFYSLGYYSDDESPRGKVRKIKVKVDQPNVAVRARDSYVAGESKRN